MIFFYALLTDPAGKVVFLCALLLQPSLFSTILAGLAGISDYFRTKSTAATRPDTLPLKRLPFVDRTPVDHFPTLTETMMASRLHRGGWHRLARRGLFVRQSDARVSTSIVERSQITVDDDRIYENVPRRTNSFMQGFRAIRKRTRRRETADRIHENVDDLTLNADAITVDAPPPSRWKSHKSLTETISAAFDDLLTFRDRSPRDDVIARPVSPPPPSELHSDRGYLGQIVAEALVHTDPTEMPRNEGKTQRSREFRPPIFETTVASIPEESEVDSESSSSGAEFLDALEEPTDTQLREAARMAHLNVAHDQHDVSNRHDLQLPSRLHHKRAPGKVRERRLSTVEPPDDPGEDEEIFPWGRGADYGEPIYSLPYRHGAGVPVHEKTQTLHPGAVPNPSWSGISERSGSRADFVSVSKEIHSEESLATSSRKNALRLKHVSHEESTAVHGVPWDHVHSSLSVQRTRKYANPAHERAHRHWVSMARKVKVYSKPDEQDGGVDGSNGLAQDQNAFADGVTKLHDASASQVLSVSSGGAPAFVRAGHGVMVRSQLPGQDRVVEERDGNLAEDAVLGAGPAAAYRHQGETSSDSDHLLPAGATSAGRERARAHWLKLTENVKVHPVPSPEPVEMDVRRDDDLEEVLRALQNCVRSGRGIRDRGSGNGPVVDANSGGEPSVSVMDHREPCTEYSPENSRNNRKVNDSQVPLHVIPHLDTCIEYDPFCRYARVERPSLVPRRANRGQVRDLRPDILSHLDSCAEYDPFSSFEKYERCSQSPLLPTIFRMSHVELACEYLRPAEENRVVSVNSGESGGRNAVVDEEGQEASFIHILPHLDTAQEYSAAALSEPFRMKQTPTLHLLRHVEVAEEYASGDWVLTKRANVSQAPDKAESQERVSGGGYQAQMHADGRGPHMHALWHVDSTRLYKPDSSRPASYVPSRGSLTHRDGYRRYNLMQAYAARHGHDPVSLVVPFVMLHKEQSEEYKYPLHSVTESIARRGRSTLRTPEVSRFIFPSSRAIVEGAPKIESKMDEVDLSSSSDDSDQTITNCDARSTGGEARSPSGLEQNLTSESFQDGNTTLRKKGMVQPRWTNAERDAGSDPDDPQHVKASPLDVLVRMRAKQRWNRAVQRTLLQYANAGDKATHAAVGLQSGQSPTEQDHPPRLAHHRLSVVVAERVVRGLDRIVEMIGYIVPIRRVVCRVSCL